MDLRELTKLLRTLRKFGVTSYPTPDGPIILSGEAREVGEAGGRARRPPPPGSQATAEIDVGDLPELEDGDGDPRTFLADLANANDPRKARERKAAS